jgi:3-oxoadipate enol-lactonase
VPVVRANGIDFYFEWYGPEGEDIVIFNNGLLMTTAGWAYQKSVISRHWRILLYDCRGQGKTDHPDSPYTMELHADDLRALMDALAVNSAHLVGISYGGEIALLFASRWPERVKSLFISSSVSEIHPYLHCLVDKWKAVALRKDGDLLYRVTVNDNFSPQWLNAHPQWENSSLPYFRAFDFDALIRLCESFSRINFTSELKNITAPTMLAAGQYDTLKPCSPYTEILAHHIPQSQIILFAGAGHACNIEAASSWNASVLGFLQMVNHGQK